MCARTAGLNHCVRVCVCVCVCVSVCAYLDQIMFTPISQSFLELEKFLPKYPLVKIV